MTTTYTYKIRQLITEDHAPHTLVVRRILFTVTADAGPGLVADIAESLDLSMPEGSFTDFSQLTESQVMTWLNSGLTPQIAADHKSRLDEKIQRLTAAKQLNTQLITHLPWTVLDPADLPVPNQLLTVTESLDPNPNWQFFEPGCYLLNPDGTLKSPRPEL